MNSSPNPLSFIQLGLGAGGRKEGEHVGSGLVLDEAYLPSPMAHAQL